MKIKRKVKSQSGLTLAEMLVATIILLLVSAIVVQGIPVAKNAYEKVVVAANAKVMLTTAITALRNELATAQRIRQNTVGVTYYSSDRGADSSIYMNTEDKLDSNYPAGAVMIQEYEDYGSDSTTDTSTFQLLNPDWTPDAGVTVSARELIASLEARRGGTDRLYVCCDDIKYVCLNPDEATAEKRKYEITISGLKVCRTSDADASNPLAQFGTDSTDNILNIRVIPNEAKFQDAVAPPAE